MIAGSGALLYAGGETLAKNIQKQLDQKQREAEAAVIYSVRKEEQSHEGLLFETGKQFKILKLDGDAALIVFVDDVDNPYFVSAKFLESISDYRKSEGTKIKNPFAKTKSKRI